MTVCSMTVPSGGVLAVFPAVVAALDFAIRGGDDGGRFLAGTFAGEADADEAFGNCERDEGVDVLQVLRSYCCTTGHCTWQRFTDPSLGSQPEYVSD